MTESPYAIPVDELIDSARVRRAAQIQEQPERRFLAGDTSGGLVWGDGTTGDADGE